MLKNNLQRPWQLQMNPLGMFALWKPLQWRKKKLGNILNIVYTADTKIEFLTTKFFIMSSWKYIIYRYNFHVSKENSWKF